MAQLMSTLTVSASTPVLHTNESSAWPSTMRRNRPLHTSTSVVPKVVATAQEK